MNEKNVEALAALLHEIVPPNTVRLGTVTVPKGPVEECDFCQATARKLSTEGVLVPSAPTYEQLDRMPRTLEPHLDEEDESRFLQEVAQWMERIAKGEG